MGRLMRIGKRGAIFFDRTAWAGAGFFIHNKTVWIDFMGFYLNLHLGRQEGKQKMTHHTEDALDAAEQFELLDEDAKGDDAKSETAMDPAWIAREAGFLRQVALEKAVQVARVALAHGRVSESNAADFTVSAAEKFHAYLTQ